MIFFFLFFVDWIDMMFEVVKCWLGRDLLLRWLLFEVVEMYLVENERESDGVGIGGWDLLRVFELSGFVEVGGFGLLRIELFVLIVLVFDGYWFVNL